MKGGRGFYAHFYSMFAIKKEVAGKLKEATQ
jgi:hypothetical protein